MAASILSRAIRLTVLFVLFSSLFVSALFSPMIRERRLYQHGFLPEIVLADDE